MKRISPESLNRTHCANIRGSQTRRQAFSRYYAYMRVTVEPHLGENLQCELVRVLHRIDLTPAPMKSTFPVSSMSPDPTR